MTKEQLVERLVRRKFCDTTRQALMLVLVEGKGQAEAARLLGLHRNQVNRALRLLGVR